MSTCIDGLTFALTARAAISAIAIAGAGSRLLTLQYPRMAAAGWARPTVCSTVTMILIDVTAKMLHVMAAIALIISFMPTGRMGNCHICAL